MDFALQSVSEPGRAFVALCEAHEGHLLACAARHDAEGSFAQESFGHLVRSGVTAATVPVELGGLGVTALRDHCAGLNRLGRGDGSVAIAISMHLWRVRLAARGWHAPRQAGDAAQEEAQAALLRRAAAGGTIAILSSEPGGRILHPMAEAARDGDGWRLSGQKAFATGCPSADLLNARFRVKDAAGEYRSATALIPAGTPGIEIRGAWDGLGMRGSGSHDVVFADCHVAAITIDTSGPWGEATPNDMIAATTGVIGLVAAFLGIAEAAREMTLEQVKTRGCGGQPAVQHVVAQMEIDLAIARAMPDRSTTQADAVLAAHPAAIPPEALRALLKDIQATKHVTMRKAVEVVDHAMTLSGGSGYLARSPLARLYRDVRAGPFMQPFSPVEAFEPIGRITLDLPA